MYKVMTGVAALTLLGATAIPLPASATDHQAGATTHAAKSGQATEFSSQRRYYRRHYGYWGPRRYWGPRYGYYGYPYRGYPYGDYDRPYYPGVAVGIGLFLHQAGARHDHRVDVGVDGLARRDLRGRAQILDAAIGA